MRERLASRLFTALRMVEKFHPDPDLDDVIKIGIITLKVAAMSVCLTQSAAVNYLKRLRGSNAAR